MQHSLGKNWHHLPAEEVIELLETDPEAGLDVFEVKHRRDHYGPNVLTARGGPGALKRFLLQFHQPLIYILLAAGGDHRCSCSEWVDAAVIFGVVLVNAIGRLHPGGQGREGHRGAGQDDDDRGHGAARRRAGSGCPRPSWCPATSSCCSPATRCRPTCGCSAAATCRSTSRRSPASRVPGGQAARGRSPTTTVAGRAQQHGLRLAPWSPTARRQGVVVGHRRRHRDRPHLRADRGGRRAGDAADAEDRRVQHAAARSSSWPWRP